MPNVLQQSVHCPTAHDFLEALSPLGQNFDDVEYSERWLFRGQGSDKPLIPTLFRDENILTNLTNEEIPITPAKRDLIGLRLLYRFFEIADKRGLILPDDSQVLRAELETINAGGAGELVLRGSTSMETNIRVQIALHDESGTYGLTFEVHNRLLSIEALAQHFGLPTRLLDWTRQAYIAAFFAAESRWRQITRRLGSNSKEDDATENMVVWAFYFPHLGKHGMARREIDPVQIVSAPSATNANLKAQQGLFTLTHPQYSMDKDGAYLALDDILEGKAELGRSPKYELTKINSVEELVSGCALRKFTLPASEAKELLRLLAKLDITPSAIYPGYQKIVNDLEMQAPW